MLNENIEKLQYIYKVYTSVCVCITEMEQFFNNTLYDLQNELTKFRFKFIEILRSVANICIADRIECICRQLIN